MSNTTAGVKKSREKMRAQRSTTVRRAQEALTAAAEILKPGERKELPGPNSQTRTWQHAAYGYNGIVPELGAATLYVGNCLSRIKLKIGKRNPDGTVEAIPDGVLEPDPNNPGTMKAELPDGVSADTYILANEVLARVRSKIGGQGELLRSYGEKMFLMGEMFLIPQDSPAGLVYEALSTLELAKDGDKWVRYNGPGYSNEPLGEGVEPIRVHRPDPAFSMLATSSIRACLEILEEIVILTRLMRSSAISRMALSGVLAIAEEFDDAIDDGTGPDGQESEAAVPLAVDMITTGAKAIDDPASAAAWLPFILTGPKELIKDGIQFIEFKHDNAGLAVNRAEAIDRLANGIDLPHESVTGHGDTTFANAAVISEDRFKVHLEPTVQMFADAVSLGVLWPGMAVSLGLQASDVSDAGYPAELLSVAVTYDATDLVGHPDRSKDIIEAYRSDSSQTAVANSELRDAIGLEPDGGPDEAETAKRIDAIRLTKVRETVQGGPGDAAVPVGDAEADAVRHGETAVAASGLAMHNLLAQRVLCAAELTTERIAERMGSLIREKAKSKGAQDLELAVIDGVSNADVPRVMGAEVTRKLLAGTRDPAPSELAAFSRTVTRWAREAGSPDPGLVAQQAAARLANALDDALYGANNELTPAAIAGLVSLT